MASLRSGIVKRKLEKNVTEKKKDKTDEEWTVSEELFGGDLTAENDDTDSEHDEEPESDTEIDKVLFEDADSTLGDDSHIEEASDKSSELTDSEEDNAEENSGDSQDASDDDDDTDSGAASGSEVADPATIPQKNYVSLKKDEYDSGDTSDEEDRRNTVGEVPMWWYQEYPHIGYDLDGRQIIKPPQRDHIDDFLKKCEDPNFWRTVRDPTTGQDVVLHKEDLELLARIKEGRIPNAEHNEYEPWVEWFSREVLATPVRAFPEHKRSFLPSRSEAAQIARLVHALKMGWAKTRRQRALERQASKMKRFYDLWAAEPGPAGRERRHIAAPRRPPPTHAESYNPPPEYLLDAQEMKEWESLAETPWKRKLTVLPQRHNALRRVPAFQRFVRERFLRCLDLYLAPRAIKMRLTINPEDLVPKLPSPRDLQPFPTTEVLKFKGHTDMVRSCDFDPSGQYVVSGSDDGTVKIWEAGSGRCLRTVQAGAAVASVAWSPARGLQLVAVAAARRLLLLSPGAHVGAHTAAAQTDALLAGAAGAAVAGGGVAGAVSWEAVSAAEWAQGVRLALAHWGQLRAASWQARGDYVVTLVGEGGAGGGGRAVLVHQLSRRRSLQPFSRCKGAVQAAAFHPQRPLLFVATQRVVRVYDLLKQELVRKLLTGAQWISAIAVHPAGDNLLVASYDRKCMWFDLDLSSQPYQTLRLHGRAVRAVAFHARYPLFATGGDDPYVVVSHATVYNDLLQNPLLVPLKQLAAGAGARSSLGALALRWHPAQPWLLAARADRDLVLYA